LTWDVTTVAAVSPPGEDFEGDDPDGRFEDRHDAEGTDGVPPPSERVWRHPSELHAGAAGSAPSQHATAWPARGMETYAWRAARHRRRLVVMGVVGTAAVAAAVAAVVLLWDATSNDYTTTDASPLLAHVLTTSELTPRSPVMPPAAVSAVRSLVVLRVGAAGNETAVCGMAVGEGGLVAAPAAALARADGRIELATAGGTARATVVGIDRASNVALVRVPATLRPAPVADDGAMMPGRPATVVSVTTRAGAAPSLEWSTATISSVSTATSTGGDIAGIVADMPAQPRTCGALLLDTDGHVVGLFGGSSAWGSVFLPAPLVVGVTDQLAVAGTVRHGWLDVRGADAPVSDDDGWGGVVVHEVEPAGATAGALRTGDVIVTVSGEPVRSMAELRTRLYVLPPGASVALVVLRGGQRTTVDVELGSSP
jgi:S1-C subfamily serine protease